MKTRNKRIALIVGGLVILGAVVALVLNAFQSNLVFFFSPTQVAAGEAPKGKPFRVGGMVKEGTIQREADGVTLRFVVTDTNPWRLLEKDAMTVPSAFNINKNSKLRRTRPASPSPSDRLRKVGRHRCAGQGASP